MNVFKYGVVEDRHDPLQMGRVRVRVFGLHSQDRKNDIQISDLPWSLVLQPPNASTSAGNLSQLVEGTWVLVMYMDATLQDPLVIGSIPSRTGRLPEYSEGFSDPFGVYPRWTNPRSDLSVAAKPDEWPEHPTYKNRGDQRVANIPLAKRYNASSVLPDKSGPDFDRSTWDEFDLRGNQDSVYPYNSVREYEGGMIEEYDSSGGNERITEMHPSGSYREILSDGSTTTKIVGNGYTITLQDHNIYIEGDLNLTVNGSMRQLIRGDYITEVIGDMTTLVRGDRVTKVESNDAKEVGINHSVSIREDMSYNVGNDKILLVGRDKQIIVGRDSSKTTTGNDSEVVGKNMLRGIGKDHFMSVGKNHKLTTGEANITESVGQMIVLVDSTIQVKAEDDITMFGGPNIHLNP